MYVLLYNLLLLHIPSLGLLNFFSGRRIEEEGQASSGMRDESKVVRSQSFIICSVKCVIKAVVEKRVWLMRILNVPRKKTFFWITKCFATSLICYDKFYRKKNSTQAHISVQNFMMTGNILQFASSFSIKLYRISQVFIVCMSQKKRTLWSWCQFPFGRQFPVNRVLSLACGLICLFPETFERQQQIIIRSSSAPRVVLVQNYWSRLPAGSPLFTSIVLLRYSKMPHPSWILGLLMAMLILCGELWYDT